MKRMVDIIIVRRIGTSNDSNAGLGWHCTELTTSQATLIKYGF